MAPVVPSACRFSCPAVFEAGHWEWCLGGSGEELDWQLQAARVSQEDRRWNLGLAAGMQEGQRKR